MEDRGRWQEGKGRVYKCVLRVCALIHVSALRGETRKITTNTFAPACPSHLSLIRSFSCLLFVYSKPLEIVCSVAPEGVNTNTAQNGYQPEILTQYSRFCHTSGENDCQRVKWFDEICPQTTSESKNFQCMTDTQYTTWLLLTYHYTAVLTALQ